LAAKTLITSPTFTGTVAGTVKAMVNLGNVDHATDANKPISCATQNAFNLKQYTLIAGNLAGAFPLFSGKDVQQV
jgi:hypothetical protein